ncbi:transcriptional regulator, AlpA family [Xaviernesmea oryzae]|uniref:Transcriptional regulator, AlpA family n=1 Tax=Xaviernesmea oryzae TaxID=464029 RepID=A0A1X7FK16_9HYPH|nr:AlpA family phage regulatory protein [Xaviernesmea oryzae]SMF53110.1 transcriptional regulator, AlpA family [Xaviernesmea oryzae]
MVSGLTYFDNDSSGARILDGAEKGRRMLSENDNRPRLIAMEEVCEVTSLSRAMINKLRTRGAFPKHVQLCERRIAFVRDEVEAWLDQRIAARAA